MAGPSVVVRVLGDLKGLGSSFDGASQKAQSASSRIHGAFTSVLGTLNASGVLGPFGESLATVNETLDKMAEHGKTVGQVMLGVGGTLAGVGLGLQAIGSKDQAAHQQLQAAVEATGHSYDEYEKQVEGAIKTQEKYGHTADQTQDALRALTQATHDPAKALQLLATASNVAAAKHEDLNTAATQVGKVFNGNTKLLKEYGISIDKTTGKTEDGKTATQALADVTAGQAAAAADTFSGKLAEVKAKVEDAAAAFGQKYGPAITAAGAGMTLLGGAVEAGGAVLKTFQATTEATTAATEAMTAAAEAQAVATDGVTAAETAADVAGAPLLLTIGLIVLAVAALAAVGYLIYRNWSTIWGGIKAIVEAVFNWIKTNWPLLLGILTGPIGLAVVLIIKYWDQIKGAAVAAFQWLQRNWPLVLAILTGPIGLAVLAIQRNWGTIVGFFSGIISQIGNVFAGVINVIVAPFKWAFNSIADLWNNTVGSLSFKIPGWVPGVGGKGFDMPKIPHMAQGGLITQTGLIFAHAGEAIIPAPAGTARQGPAVHIENATFTSDIDVEAFMRRAAWVVQTARI